VREIRGERHGRSGRSRQHATARFVAAITIAACASVPGRAAGQGIAFEVRAGVVGSTPLAEDRIASQALLERLGARFDGGVKAVPAPSPIVAISARAPLRGRFEAELSAGWTFADLRASDAAGDRSIQSLGAGHAIIGVRYRPASLWDVGGGFGVLRYVADDTGLFADGVDLSPLLEGSVGIAVPGSRGRVVLRATGQAHRFNTPALRFSRAADGTVLRASVQAGVRLGGAR
jgi:hypothetical protein